MPDTQGLTGPNSGVVPDVATCEPSKDPKSGCRGEYCKKSPYCQGSWSETNRRLLRNMAYEMTGQWQKIDYTGISGNDKTESHWSGPKDHPRCDLVLSLGDITNVPDGVYQADYSYEQLQTHQREWDAALDDFWAIIDAAGVPYVLTQGNHDPGKPYRRLMQKLGVTKKPYFHSLEETRKISYAIKPKLPTGHHFCVISLAWAPPGRKEPSAADLKWAAETWGCGADLPTIATQHAGQGLSTAVGESGNAAKTFLLANGHWVTKPYTSKRFNKHMGFFVLFSNFQTVPRWGIGAGNGGRGVTEWDGYGGMYTVVRISPEKKKVQAWDWSPYFLSRHTHPDDGTSSLDQEFDFDARFGAPK